MSNKPADSKVREGVANIFPCPEGFEACPTSYDDCNHVCLIVADQILAYLKAQGWRQVDEKKLTVLNKEQQAEIHDSWEYDRRNTCATAPLPQCGKAGLELLTEIMEL